MHSGGPNEAQVQSYSPGGANVPTWGGTLAPPTAAMRSYVKLLSPLVIIYGRLWNRADHYIFVLSFVMAALRS